MLAELVQAADDCALLAPHTHEPWVRFTDDCARCLAERTLYRTARRRLRARCVHDPDVQTGVCDRCGTRLEWYDDGSGLAWHVVLDEEGNP